jgi:DNA-binding CsgD family transcriptional regulator
LSYLRFVAVLHERDVSAMLGIVEISALDSGLEPFPSAVLTALADLIPSDACVGYQEADISGKFRAVETLDVGKPVARKTEKALHAFGWQNPMHCRLHAHETQVLRLSDLLGRRQKRRLEYDAAVWQTYGIDDALRVWLPAPYGRARSVYLERSGKNYTDREVAMLAVMRPYLVRARQSAALRRASAEAVALTPRESEVLALIAEGRTNNEIAQLLTISPFTVRQHVENIFGKLGVTTRAAAVALVAAHSGAARH